MADLFSKTETLHGGAMTAQNGIITMAGAPGIGLLMQNLQLQYNQQITRIYELGEAPGPTRSFYVSGRANGSMSMSHILGPGMTLNAFYQKYSDVCAAGSNSLDLTLGANFCGTGNALSTLPLIGQLFQNRTRYRCKFCVIQGVSVQVQSNDFVVNAGTQLMFSGMEYFGQ